MADTRELYIKTKVEDMIVYGNICLKQFPKHERYALASEIRLTTAIRGPSRAVQKWTIAGRGALVHGPQRLLSWVIPRLCLLKFLATI